MRGCLDSIFEMSSFSIIIPYPHILKGFLYVSSVKLLRELNNLPGFHAHRSKKSIRLVDLLVSIMNPAHLHSGAGSAQHLNRETARQLRGGVWITEWKAFSQ